MRAEALAMPAMTGEEQNFGGQEAAKGTFINSILTSRPAQFITGIAAGLAGYGVVDGFVGVATADAQASSGATAADVFNWDNVGGAPLVDGGVHSLGAAKKFLESPLGHATLKREGLNKAERTAVEKAVHAGKLHSCTIPAGKIMESMVSAGMDLKKNVVLGDPDDPNGIPGFCVTATRTYTKGHKTYKETIKDGVADACNNGLLFSTSTTTLKQPKPHTAPVEVFKIALDDTGKQLVDNKGDAITPTGTFRFEAKCKDGKNTVDTTVIYNQSPQPLLKCNVGSNVTVTELSTLGNEQWSMLSPATQTMVVSKDGDKFVFKDAELPPTTTPPPVTPPCAPGTNLETINGAPVCVTPKDGTQGPGTGTPGQPGGPGAGGQPGNPGGSGETCIDTADTTNGDMNATTQGDVMYGIHDQFGYCVGSATPLVNG
jgi:hypothetical protein